MENQEAPGWSQVGGDLLAPQCRERRIPRSFLPTFGYGDSPWALFFEIGSLASCFFHRLCGARLRVADRLKARTNCRVGFSGFTALIRRQISSCLSTEPFRGESHRGSISRCGRLREESSTLRSRVSRQPCLSSFAPGRLQLRQGRQPQSVFFFVTGVSG